MHLKMTQLDLSLSTSTMMKNFCKLIHIFLILSKCTVLFAARLNHENQASSKIVGGHEADPHSHPYIVSLQMRFLWVRTHLCGGTLLSEKWILTAAHCISESWIIRWLPMDAIAGLHEIDHYGRQAQVIPIAKRIPHPDYKGDVGPNDIAMLSTEMPFILGQVIKPAKLPTTNYKVDYSSLMLTGWGVLRSTAFLPDLPDRLQELQVTYLSYEKCYEAINFSLEDDEENPLDKDANICTGPLYGGVAACNGDSGGPLVQILSKESDEINNDIVEEVTEENDYLEYNETLLANDGGDQQQTLTKETRPVEQFPVVVGVVSWGISPCGKKGAPTVYTKVIKYIDFINHYLKN